VTLMQADLEFEYP